MLQKCLKFEIYNKKNIKDQGHVPGLAIDFGIGGWPRAFGGVLERRSMSWAGSVSWVVIRIWVIESEFKMLQFPILKGWNDDETWSEGVRAVGCQSFPSARSWSSQLSSWALRISCARSCAFGRVTLDFAQGEALTSTSSCEQAKIKTFQILPTPCLTCNVTGIVCCQALLCNKLCTGILQAQIDWGELGDLSQTGGFLQAQSAAPVFSSLQPSTPSYARSWEAEAHWTAEALPKSITVD